ncbi:hypothetical protein ACWEHT_11450 [Streptomyces sp. NPDC004646]
MTDTAPEHPPVPVPSEDEIRTALRTVLHGWYPRLLLPGEHGYTKARAAEDEFDPYDGCQCAGTDEDGEPLGCNCGDGCSCESCEHFRYLRQRVCQAGNPSVGTRCTRETAYRVVAYRMQHSNLGAPRAEGQQCPHQTGAQQDTCYCTAQAVFYESGLYPVTYHTRSACSVRCAQDIVAQEKAWRGEHNALDYYIERWSYVPHDLDLPEELAALRAHTRMAKLWVGQLIEAFAQGKDASLAERLKFARVSIALAAWAAQQDPFGEAEEQERAEDSGPVQEEPSEPDDLE